jgi:hypothetical protein
VPLAEGAVRVLTAGREIEQARERELGERQAGQDPLSRETVEHGRARQVRPDPVGRELVRAEIVRHDQEHVLLSLGGKREGGREEGGEQEARANHEHGSGAS